MKYKTFRANTKLFNASKYLLEIFYWVIYPNVLEISIKKISTAMMFEHLVSDILVMSGLILHIVISTSFILYISYLIPHNHFSVVDAMTQ